MRSARMRRAKTYFEQVPVTVAKILAGKQHTSSSLPTCCLCDRPIEIEHSKTDEYGRAIHEQCYVARLALEMATKQASAEMSKSKL
jgi:hypothetical protein